MTKKCSVYLQVFSSPFTSPHTDFRNAAHICVPVTGAGQQATPAWTVMLATLTICILQFGQGSGTPLLWATHVSWGSLKCTSWMLDASWQLGPQLGLWSEHPHVACLLASWLPLNMVICVRNADVLTEWGRCPINLYAWEVTEWHSVTSATGSLRFKGRGHRSHLLELKKKKLTSCFTKSTYVQSFQNTPHPSSLPETSKSRYRHTSD